VLSGGWFDDDFPSVMDFSWFVKYCVFGYFPDNRKISYVDACLYYALKVDNDLTL
jgi:hypothetical protein